MTEAELFAAYRTAAGYLAQCACGEWISAPSTSSREEIGEAVVAHNESTEHLAWSTGQEAVLALRRVPVHICKCHLHGGVS